jgi:hypothetical protein
MAVALTFAFVYGDFQAEGRMLLSMPWGILSLVDLYAGFTLFSAWIVFREESLLRAGLWVAVTLILGFFAAAVYALIALYRSQGDWEWFFFGSRARPLGSGVRPGGE